MTVRIPTQAVSDAKLLQREAAAIRRLHKQAMDRTKEAIRDYVEIGKRLAWVKDRVGHGNWLPWLRKNFKWSGGTAANYINLCQLSQHPKFSTVENLLPARTLYEIARRNVQEGTLRAIAEQVEAGETVTPASARAFVAKTKIERRKPLKLTVPTRDVSVPVVSSGYIKDSKDPPRLPAPAPKPPGSTLRGVGDDMPTQEEADESYQATLYDHACDIVDKEMSGATRQRFFAHLKRKYDVSFKQSRSQDEPAPASFPPVMVDSEGQTVISGDAEAEAPDTSKPKRDKLH